MNHRPPASRPVQRSCRASIRVRAALCILGAPVILAATGSAADSDLPVRRITLYRSGIAAVEREGQARGNHTFTLRFRQDEIDDLLKSMVVLDPAGRPGVVGYASRDPLERRLGSLSINLSGNPSIAQILLQVRGSRVRFALTDEAVEGTVLGVEERVVPRASTAGAGAPAAPRAEPVVSVLTTSGIRAIAIADIRAFDLLDARLAEDLQRALAAVVEERTEQIRSVDVSVVGDGGAVRPVTVAYVQVAPVWKTSYRLVLPEGESSAAIMQAWAIVENQTDEDWTNVSLSLASGRPIAFQMRLSDPYYTSRPLIPVPAVEGLRPRDFERGMATADAAPPPSAAPGSAMRRTAGRGGGAFGGQADDAMIAERAMSMADISGGDALGEVSGELFLFTVPVPVSIERRRSAMLPLATTRLGARRLSIFDPATMTRSPMRGVEIVNESDLELLPGPIAVYDGERYAGDATIAQTSRGQERLVVFAEDSEVTIRREPKRTRSVISVSIGSGSLRTRMREDLDTGYAVENADTLLDRTILIEHQRTPGFDLVEGQKPKAETSTGHRFEVQVAKAAKVDFTVSERRTWIDSTVVTDVELQTVLQYVTSGRASQRIADAVRQAIDRRAEVRRIEQQMESLSKQESEIVADQARIRSNMGAVDRQSTLYAQYMQRLTAQEKELDDLRAQRRALTEERDRKARELETWLRGLNLD